MRKALILVLTLLLLAAGCAAAAAETTTLLVYMCGTDLQQAGCLDMVEMSEAYVGDAVNIVVLAGGAKEWDFEALEGGTRTLAVIRDDEFERLEDWGAASMGSPESLEEFLRRGMTEYPADRTIVVLWDHGAGTEGGICFDETAGDDSLTVAEISRVLENLEKSVPDYRINIFGCDACMMATYEMAAMLAEHSIDYFVASEELEPGIGWNYTPWLEMLREDPTVPDTDVCGMIVESFMEAGLENDPEDFLTLSAVDLSEMDGLKKNMEAFAGTMTGQIEAGNLSAIRRGRSRLYTFGSFDDGSWDMVDLGAMLDAYAQFDADSAAEAKRCLSRAVIVSSQTDNLDACSGLAVLMPQDTAETLTTYSEGFDLSGVIPNWIAFVNRYAAGISGGSYHFTASSGTQISEGDTFDNTFVSASSWFGSAMIWNDEAGCYSEEEEETIAISEGDQGFYMTLSAEDLEYLDYVEGMLLMDISEDDGIAFVDFGLMQNNLIDWNSGTVVSLYDGNWPVFGGQPVPLYDQNSNEHSRRSLIPVKLNGEYTYLVVVFPAGSTEGRVIGANAGYDENGLPIRNTAKLQPGDEIIPVYTMYYEEEGKEDLQETEFEGERILWEEGMTVTYENLSDGEETTEMLFCFVLNDIFGEETLSDMIAFEL